MYAYEHRYPIPVFPRNDGKTFPGTDERAREGWRGTVSLEPDSLPIDAGWAFFTSDPVLQWFSQMADSALHRGCPSFTMLLQGMV